MILLSLQIINGGSSGTCPRFASSWPILSYVISAVKIKRSYKVNLFQVSAACGSELGAYPYCTTERLLVLDFFCTGTFPCSGEPTWLRSRQCSQCRAYCPIDREEYARTQGIVRLPPIIMFLSLLRNLHHKLPSSDTLSDVKYLPLASLIHLCTDGKTNFQSSELLSGFR